MTLYKASVRYVGRKGFVFEADSREEAIAVAKELLYEEQDDVENVEVVTVKETSYDDDDDEPDDWEITL